MNKILKTIIWPIMAVPLAYVAIIWNQLSEPIAIHFNLKGEADKFGTKNDLLLMIIIISVINAATYLLLRNVYRIDPRKNAKENKSRLEMIGFAVCVFIAAILCYIIYNGTHPGAKFSMQFTLVGIGLLLAFIGNYMHSIKPNYFAGIRLPWTLENEDNWRRTHLLAGKLFFAGGLLAAIICLFLPPVTSFIVFFGITMIMVLVPCIYSYLLYKKQKSN